MERTCAWSNPASGRKTKAAIAAWAAGGPAFLGVSKTPQRNREDKKMNDETRTVTVEREFQSPPEKLWRALTQPHLIEEWLMKNDFKADVGHKFHLRMDAQEG